MAGSPAGALKFRGTTVCEASRNAILGPSAASFPRGKGPKFALQAFWGYEVRWRPRKPSLTGKAQEFRGYLSLPALRGASCGMISGSLVDKGMENAPTTENPGG